MEGTTPTRSTTLPHQTGGIVPIIKSGNLYSYNPFTGWNSCYAILQGEHLCLWTRSEEVAGKEPTAQIKVQDYSVLPIEGDVLGFIVVNQFQTLTFRAPTVEDKNEWVLGLSHVLHPAPQYHPQQQPSRPAPTSTNPPPLPRRNTAPQFVHNTHLHQPPLPYNYPTQHAQQPQPPPHPPRPESVPVPVEQQLEVLKGLTPPSSWVPPHQQPPPPLPPRGTTATPPIENPHGATPFQHPPTKTPPPTCHPFQHVSQPAQQQHQHPPPLQQEAQHPTLPRQPPLTTVHIHQGPAGVDRTSYRNSFPPRKEPASQETKPPIPQQPLAGTTNHYAAVPRLSMEELREQKKREKKERMRRKEMMKEKGEKETGGELVEHTPHRKSTKSKLASATMKLAKKGVKLGIKSGMEAVSSVSNQYVTWSILFQKSNYRSAPLLSSAVLCAELSGLIYEPSGFVEQKIDTFDLLGHIFTVNKSSTMDTDLPFWALLTNQTEGRLYFVFRGTDNTIDSLIDANAQLHTVTLSGLEFRAHGGCHKFLTSKLAELKPLICESYAASNGQLGITITGHSLGGAYAILFYLFLIGEGLIPPEKIDCYTFGAPAVVAPPKHVTDPTIFVGWGGMMGQYEHNVHNFIHAFDIVPRSLGNGAGVKLINVIANMKDDVQTLARYCEVARDTDFVRNTALYQPYGEYYFVYDGEHVFHMIKAEDLEEKRIAMTMPVMASFRPKRIVEDHFIANYITAVKEYLTQCTRNS